MHVDGMNPFYRHIDLADRWQETRGKLELKTDKI